MDTNVFAGRLRNTGIDSQASDSCSTAGSATMAEKCPQTILFRGWAPFGSRP